jgi:hypothetical protein
LEKEVIEIGTYQKRETDTGIQRRKSIIRESFTTWKINRKPLVYMKLFSYVYIMKEFKLSGIDIPVHSTIMNEPPEGYEIIGTCFSKSLSEVKSDMEEYLNRELKFYMYEFSGIYTVRILKKINDENNR